MTANQHTRRITIVLLASFPGSPFGNLPSARLSPKSDFTNYLLQQVATGEISPSSLSHRSQSNSACQALKPPNVLLESNNRPGSRPIRTSTNTNTMVAAPSPQLTHMPTLRDLQRGPRGCAAVLPMADDRGPAPARGSGGGGARRRGSCPPQHLRRGSKLHKRQPHYPV